MSVPTTIKGFSSKSPESWEDINVVEYEPKNFSDDDVSIKVDYCGVCAADYHSTVGDWGPYRDDKFVAGHEIAGTVVKVGKNVKSIKVGEGAGVGPISDSCGECKICKEGLNQYCSKVIQTYNCPHYRADDYVTKGGFGSHVIASQAFVFPIPASLPKKYAAPLMCAGLTAFSPIYRALGHDGTGKTVGIIGIGGLGHLGIQFAKALGATVVAFSRSSAKKADALKLGADQFVATGEDKEWNQKYFRDFDIIVNCASGYKDINFAQYLYTLKVQGEFVTVGAPNGDESISLPGMPFLSSGVSVSTSVCGTKTEAIEMLKLAAEKKIYPVIEELPLSKESIKEAIERVGKSDVKYRFVLTDYDKCFH